MSEKLRIKLLYKELQVKDQRVSGCVVNRGGQEKAREKCQGKDTIKENRAQRI